jgi:hypothetical protein
VKEENKSKSEEFDDSDFPTMADIKKRDACRLIRALKKVACALRGPREAKAKKPEKKVYRAFITLEDQVVIHHLSHRVGKQEEFQTTLQHPHQFRKTLIRVYRLKNLRWSLLRKQQDGSLMRMPELMQILEDDVDCVVRIEAKKRKRPNAPGSSKRSHFERASQTRREQDFNWSPDQAESSQRHDPKMHEARRSKDGHHEEGNPDRFTWTSEPEPQVEPPRPRGWKPLVLVPELIRLSDDAARKLDDKRLEEWSKDQEEYEERQFQDVEKRKREAKARAEKQEEFRRKRDEEERIQREEKRTIPEGKERKAREEEEQTRLKQK